jgi:hypothetical protein
MFAYFDLTFFAVLKLLDGNQSTQARKVATIVSYVILTLSIIVPLFFMTVLCRRFEVLKIKQAK